VKKEIGLIKPAYSNLHGLERFALGNKEPLTYISSLFATEKSLARLENLICIQCGSEYKVEMHHVRKLKDLKSKISYVNKLVIKAKRKQIPLCRVCHMNKQFPSR
jgi:thymidine kinase